MLLSTDTAHSLRDPIAVAAWVALVPAVVFRLSGIPRLGKSFEVVPPILFVYFLPTIATTLGVTPVSSSTYD